VQWGVPTAGGSDAARRGRALGPDPWENGLTPRNRMTLETLARYSHEQGLTRRLIPLDELFLDVSEGRKRGGFRI